MFEQLVNSNYHNLCDLLAERDQLFAGILAQHGYPPLWQRPNNFESLVHIILEQQVSQASAKATLEKLRQKVITVVPEAVLMLSDQEMKACYVSRQKAHYIRGLAEVIRAGELDLLELETLTDDQVRTKLVQFKGIGNWTIDIYLIFVLHRLDVFPVGDLAAVQALRQLKQAGRPLSSDAIIKITDTWRPYRTIATMLLWHHYLSVRAKPS